MNHSTKKPTQAQAWRLEALASMPCKACQIEEVPQPSRTEIHHIVDKGYRKHSGGHDATLPLCGWHHRGEPKQGFSSVLMRGYYGPSLALHKRDFVGHYGTERELLEAVNAELEVEA